MFYLCAAIQGVPPAAPPTPALQEISPLVSDNILSRVSPELRDTGCGLMRTGADCLLHRKLVSAFGDLREVTLYRECYNGKDCDLSTEEIEYFHWKGYRLRYLCHSIPFERQRSSGDAGDANEGTGRDKSVIQTDDGRQEPCRLALLTYYHSNHLVSQPSSATFRLFTVQLKAALEGSDLSSFWVPYPELLMWVLFVGAHISVGQVEWQWFISYLARGAQLLDIGTLAGLRKMLLRYFYIDRVYGSSLISAWEEMQKIRHGLDVHEESLGSNPSGSVLGGNEGA